MEVYKLLLHSTTTTCSVVKRVVIGLQFSVAYIRGVKRGQYVAQAKNEKNWMSYESTFCIKVRYRL